MPRRLMKLLTHQTTNGSHLQSVLWLFEAGCFPPKAGGSCPPNALARLGCCSFSSPWAPRAWTTASGEAGSRGRRKGPQNGAASALSNSREHQTASSPRSSLSCRLGRRANGRAWGLQSSIPPGSRPLLSGSHLNHFSAPDLLRGGW